jgi:DNA end-binding protein Ku
MRPIWKGAISFGLVTIPVGLYTATDDLRPKFRQLRSGDHSRINDDLGSPPKARRAGTVDVVQFVKAEEIDPIFYRSSYYLAPEKTGAKAYRILSRALAERGMVGLARVAIRDREYPATLRAEDGVIVMETMYWPDEIREPEFEELAEEVEVRPEELRMAGMIIDNLTAPFDPTQWVDDTREAVEELARRKMEGQEIVSTSTPQPTGVVDLMEALKASVEATKAKRKAG